MINMELIVYAIAGIAALIYLVVNCGEFLVYLAIVIGFGALMYVGCKVIYILLFVM